MPRSAKKTFFGCSAIIHFKNNNYIYRLLIKILLAMKTNKTISRIVSTILLLCSATIIFAQETNVHNLSSILEVQQYDRAIHIMAMLLIGFGFLMVFVKKYGRSALTATFLLVSISLPLYMSIKGLGIFESKGEIEQLILAEFGAASLLIAAGAILGRIKIYQFSFCRKSS